MNVEPITDWATAGTDLLKTADQLVNGTREKTYGSAPIHHARTAALWSTYLQFEVRPEQVSVLFILDKIARSMEQEKPDNFTDIAGYAQVHAKVMAAKETPHCPTYTALEGDGDVATGQFHD